MNHLIYINDYDGFDWFKNKIFSLNDEYKEIDIDLIRFNYRDWHLDTMNVIYINSVSGCQNQYDLSKTAYRISISLFVVSEKFAEYPEVGISHDQIGMKKVCSDLYKCGVSPDQIIRECDFFRDIMGLVSEPPKLSRFELLDI